MITTGLIKEINISDKIHKNNLYKVEIGIFKTPGDVSENNGIYTCTSCLPGGINNVYNVGDRVYIGFINNEIGQPTILGKIYMGLPDNIESESRGYNFINSLNVTSSATLPINTTFKSDTVVLTFEQVIEYLNTIDYLQKSLNTVLNPEKGKYLYCNENGELTWKTLE